MVDKHGTLSYEEFKEQVEYCRKNNTPKGIGCTCCPGKDTICADNIINLAGRLREEEEPRHIFFVLSEEIEDYPTNVLSLNPPENYYIARMVVAKTHGQAKYLAWKSDKDSFNASDIQEMPKMRCNIRKRNVKLPIGVIQDTSNCPDEWWD